MTPGTNLTTDNYALTTTKGNGKKNSKIAGRKLYSDQKTRKIERTFTRDVGRGV